MTAPQETPLERVRAVELTLRHHASIVGDPEESAFWTKLADKLTPALEAAPAPVLRLSARERNAINAAMDDDGLGDTNRAVLRLLLIRTKDAGGG